MGLFKGSSLPVCLSDQLCSEWARECMKLCLTSVKDGVSLSLGLVSVISWGVAEIPQIITNYKQKSTEGLSLAFLMTWILGDLFNLFGCMLEPATLPTQYYTAILYTVTTVILTSQTVYYEYIYPRLKSQGLLLKGSKPSQTVAPNNDTSNLNEANPNPADGSNGSDTSKKGNSLSSPIPLPPSETSSRREPYYMSARYLSKSHTPTAGSYWSQRLKLTTSNRICSSVEEPLLVEPTPESAPAMKIKRTLCVISATTFLSLFNLHKSADRRLKSIVSNQRQGFVIKVGRKLFQANGALMQENGMSGSGGIGYLLGWAMAAIYMGGRLPQICLNIRRGNVEGLNPLMFIFALVGNSTYVASILVSSLDWSKLGPNLPWLVESGGCILLDIFILVQFIYFNHRRSQDSEKKHGDCNAA